MHQNNAITFNKVVGGTLFGLDLEIGINLLHNWLFAE